MTEKYYSAKELEKITVEAERIRQKFPYSESDVKKTLKDLGIEESYQENVLAKYKDKKSKKLSTIIECYPKKINEKKIKEKPSKYQTMGRFLTIGGLFTLTGGFYLLNDSKMENELLRGIETFVGVFSIIGVSPLLLSLGNMFRKS